MTIPVDGETPRARSRTARRFKILIGIVVAILILWTGGWFAARHYVTGKIAAIEARAADEGATLSCAEQSVSGFPFRIGVTCTQLQASCPAEEASLDLAGIEAMGLLYNPGHALVAAKGPLQLKGPNGIGAQANWTSLESSVRLGFSGLKRYSLVTDGLDAKLSAPQRLDGPIALKADHAEFHVVPDPDTAGMFDLFASVTNGTAAVPGRPDMPPLTSDVEIAVPKAMLARGGDAVAAWMASGQPVSIRRLELDLAGLSTAIAGDATVDGNGLISGKFTVRVSALDRLPELVEHFRPGAGQKVARLIAPVSMMLRPVSAEGRNWREATINVQRGRATLGFIPLGQIPPLRRTEFAAAPAAAPAPAPAPVEAAPAPAPSLAPAAEAPATEAPATAEPPVATAAEPAPPTPEAAADAHAAAAAIKDIASAVRSARRCAVAGS